MFRGSVALAFLLLTTPLAAASAEADVERWISNPFSLLEDALAWSGLAGRPDDAPQEDHEEHDAHEADVAEEEPAREREEAPPRWTHDPLGVPISDAPPLVVRPVRETIARAPLLDAATEEAFRRLGLESASSDAAPESARLAPAAASAPAPAPAPGAAVVASGALLAAAGVVGAGAAAGSGAFAALAEKARRFALLAFLPLYSRLARADLLDHAVRDRIYAAVRDNPGLTLQELSEVGAVGRTATAYHVRVLEREGLVLSRRDGRVRRFHLNGQTLASPERLAALGHPTGRALAEAVAAEPGLDQSSLAAKLGIGPSLAHWHLKRLEGAGVVRKARDGRSVRYFPG